MVRGLAVFSARIFDRRDRVHHRDHVAVAKRVVGVQHDDVRLVAFEIARVRLPQLFELRAEVRGAIDAKRVHDRRAATHGEHERVLTRRHFDVHARDRLDRFVHRIGRPGRTRRAVEARHVGPHRGDEQERDGHHEQVDHRDHVDLRVDRSTLSTT